MNEDNLPKPTTTVTLVLRFLIYAVLLLLVLIVGIIPIVSTARISLKLLDLSTSGH
jgi:hypothetical protein